MINEHKSLKNIVGGMFRQPDGIAVVICAIACVALIAINVFAPSMVSRDYGGQNKWLAVWFATPLLLFLWYVRLRQLIESESMLANLFRITCVLVPFTVLLYFNFEVKR